MNHIIVFRLQFCATLSQQQLHEGVQKLDIALGGLKGKRVHAGPVFADAVDSSTVELHYALIASADVEDVREPAVLLFKRDNLVPMYRLAGTGWPDDEHDAN